MEHYTYLLLGLSLTILAGASLYLRKDIALRVLRLAIPGGIIGPLSELFYFRDYWRPQTIVGVARFSPEDVIFGFAITVLSVVAYPLLARQTFAKSDKPNHRNLYMLFFICGLIALFVFNIWLGINSIFVSSAAFLCFSVIILSMRRDLLKTSLISAATITLITIGIYILLFDLLSPHFWDNYWLLAGTKWGVTILGHVPLTEVIWYFSWALLASVSYPFVSGTIFTNLNQREPGS